MGSSSVLLHYQCLAVVDIESAAKRFAFHAATIERVVGICLCALFYGLYGRKNAVVEVEGDSAIGSLADVFQAA